MLDAARSGLPPGPARAARRTLLNVIGTAVSASGSQAAVLLAATGDGGTQDVGGRSVRTSEDSGRAVGRGGVVPGRGGVVHPYWAALATGTAAHLDDFDDTHLATVIHPGASVLATVLALAPGLEASGAAFLGAFAVGCESQLRIGNAISPAHYDRGWHITGTCGVFGAGLAAAALLGLDAEAAARALSLAAVMTVGHREAFGSMTKPLHAGKAAANGVLAARLASAGLAGPDDPLGPGGVLETLAGGPAGVARAALDAGWELELNTFKTYPCGVVAHPAMDAALAAFALLGDSPSITSVSVTCNPLVLELMGLVHPSSGLQARFSARHGIAAGLRYGRAGLAEFSDEVATDPEMARLRDLISLDPDPACARDAAVLRVATRSGDPVEVRVEHTRGSVARPLTDPELLAKVSDLVAPVLGAPAAVRIRDAVDALPAAPDVTGLLAVLRPVAPASREQRARPEVTVPAVTAPAVTVPEATSAANSAPSTDAILALALAPPALADEVVVADQAEAAKASLGAFRDAVAAGVGLSPRKGGAVERAIEAAAETGTLPEGHAWTAFTSAVAALSASAPGVSEVPEETAIVCAAATAVGENCAEAVAVGISVTGLIASGLPDASAQGWAVPVVSATVGAAVAAGLMLGLAEERLRAAIGIAATQATGLASAVGTDAGAVQAGKAAFNAVEAALLAQAGFTSCDQPLEGRRGLYALLGA